jgi:hypothetical protein
MPMPDFSAHLQTLTQLIARHLVDLRTGAEPRPSSWQCWWRRPFGHVCIGTRCVICGHSIPRGGPYGVHPRFALDGNSPQALAALIKKLRLP